MAIDNFIAGDTVVFTQNYTDYPSTKYTSVIYFNGPGTLQISGSVSTEETGSFDYTVTPTAGQYLKSGLYGYSIRVMSASIAYTVESGNISVYANPATQVSREYICSRMIDLIEKALLNQLSTGEAAESISIAGRSISMMNRTDLLNERGFWNRERTAINNARTGKSSIKQIKTIITQNVERHGII